MRALTVWQPFASLIVNGCKTFETRTWPAPQALIGQRIAISAAARFTKEQQEFCDDPEFSSFYDNCGLGVCDGLERGVVLGSVLLHSVDRMDLQSFDRVSPEERAYGNWRHGDYAWRLTEPRVYDKPIPVRGMQGLWRWKDDTGNEIQEV